MTNKVGIDVEGRLDTTSIVRQVNDMGQRIAQANKVQYKPISDATVKDVEKMVRLFEQLRRINGDLNKRMNATGQGGAGLFDLDFDRLYPDAHSRARQSRKVFEYTVGDRFSAPAPGGSGGAGSGLGRTAAGVAQAGLNAAGPVGGVAARALGTGMSAGAGAGLMGLMGGLAALGLGKAIGGIVENIGKAEENNIALDRLKRTLGDVNVSFNALKTTVRGSADSLKITYADATGLAQQFVKQGNLSADKFQTLGGELNLGVGMSRAFGMDPAQGMGFLGGMRGVGMTTNTQESRRIALLIGETIGKSGAFAKADEVMDAIAGFATSQTRQNMGAANVNGYAGMFSAMVGSGIPGLDPTGAGALLARVNSALSAGGAKGEASQFFSGSIGASMGLNPYQTRILREGGAFATADSMFGKDSMYARYKGKAGPGGSTTFLQATLDRLRKQYGQGSDELIDATANHLGLGANQAMALLSIDPNQMGEMQKYDLGKMSGSGIGNLSKVLYGSDGDRAMVAQTLLGRSDVSDADKSTLRGAMGTSSEREVLAKLTAQYDQERTMGSDIRDSKAALDNIKTAIADRLVPYVQTMRDGIVLMAGKGKSPREISEEVMRLESKDAQARIHGDYESRRRSAVGEVSAILDERKAALDNLKKNYGSMTPEQIAAEQKRIIGLTDQHATKSEEVRQRLLKLMEEEAQAIKREIEARDAKIKGLVTPAAAAGEATMGSIAGAGRGVINPPPVGGTPGAAPSTGDANLDAKLAAAEQRTGLPPGTLRAVMRRETGGRSGEFLSDPSKYHYNLDASGRRVAPHTGRISTAFGPFGILESTGRKPGYGVDPLQSKELDEQIRFASEYLAARSRSAGSLAGGLAGYGEGWGYSNGVMSNIPEQTPVVRGSDQATGGKGEPGKAEVTVKVVNDRGQEIAPPQTVQTKVSRPNPRGATASW